MTLARLLRALALPSRGEPRRRPAFAVEVAWHFAAPPDKVWSLLASPEAWSLRPGYGGFGVPATSETGRLVVATAMVSTGMAGCDVYEITDEQPGESMALRIRSVHESQAATLAFRVTPRDGGSRAVITHQVPLSPRSTARASFLTSTRIRGQLQTWLSGCAAVIEGRAPWPTQGVPASVRARFSGPVPATNDPAVSASGLIGADAATVWEVLYDPATSVRMSSATLAVGRVPGTPVRTAGEMQFSVRRQASRRVVASLIVTREYEEGRRVVFQVANGARWKTHLNCVEPTGEGTRLKLAACSEDLRDRALRTRTGQELADQLACYKALIEGSSEPVPPGKANLAHRHQTATADAPSAPPSDTPYTD